MLIGRNLLNTGKFLVDPGAKYLARARLRVSISAVQIAYFFCRTHAAAGASNCGGAVPSEAYK